MEEQATDDWLFNADLAFPNLELLTFLVVFESYICAINFSFACLASAMKASRLKLAELNSSGSGTVIELNTYAGVEEV